MLPKKSLSKCRPSDSVCFIFAPSISRKRSPQSPSALAEEVLTFWSERSLNLTTGKADYPQAIRPHFSKKIDSPDGNHHRNPADKGVLWHSDSLLHRDPLY